MKRTLFIALFAVACCVFPAFAADAPKADAPGSAVAEPAKDAPKADAPAAVKVEGKVVVVKGKDGAADTFTFKTADAELTLLPGDKLEELKKIEKVEEKTFVLEGEKVPAKDGKSEGFMIKSFEEKKADAPKEEKK